MSTQLPLPESQVPSGTILLSRRKPKPLRAIGIRVAIALCVVGRAERKALRDTVSRFMETTVA